jgi:hypothetical protein
MATLSEKQAKLFTDRKVSHTPGSDEALPSPGPVFRN